MLGLLLAVFLLQAPVLHSPLPAGLPDTGEWPYRVTTEELGIYDGEVPATGELASMRVYLNRIGICTDGPHACRINVSYAYFSPTTDLNEQAQSVGQFAISGEAGTHQGAGYIDVRNAHDQSFRLFVLVEGEWTELQPDTPMYRDEQRTYMSFLRWGHHLLEQQR